MDGTLGATPKDGDAESRMYDAVHLCASEAGWSGDKELAFSDLTLSRNLVSASRAELERAQFPVDELDRRWKVSWPGGAPDPAAFTESQWADMEEWLQATKNPDDALKIAAQVSTYLMLHRTGAEAYKILSK